MVIKHCDYFNKILSIDELLIKNAAYTEIRF